MRGQLTDADKQQIDSTLATEPIGPVIDLWEALVRAGGMPAMTGDHVRVILIALRRERGI